MKTVTMKMKGSGVIKDGKRRGTPKEKRKITHDSRGPSHTPNASKAVDAERELKHV